LTVTKQKTAISIGAAIAAIFLFRTRMSQQPVATVTTSEGFDLSPYGGPTTYPAEIKRFAEAIARAEGFYVPNSIPQRARNPGDLKVPGWSGPTLGSGISVFGDVADGWNALYHQLYIILTGQSARYNLDMSIAEMAAIWTTTQQGPWATNVAGYLGLDVQIPLWQVLAPVNT
jgi:hypothetical protein